MVKKHQFDHYKVNCSFCDEPAYCWRCSVCINCPREAGLAGKTMEDFIAVLKRWVVLLEEHDLSYMGQSGKETNYYNETVEQTFHVLGIKPTEPSEKARARKRAYREKWLRHARETEEFRLETCCEKYIELCRTARVTPMPLDDVVTFLEENEDTDPVQVAVKFFRENGGADHVA